MELIPNKNLNVVDFSEPVHDEEPIGQTVRQMKIAFAHFSVELDIFLFHPIGHVGNSMLDPFQSDFGRYVQNYRKIWDHFPYGKGVDLRNWVICDLTSDSLVYRSGIQKTIADNDLSLGQNRQDKDKAMWFRHARSDGKKSGTGLRDYEGCKAPAGEQFARKVLGFNVAVA